MTLSELERRERRAAALTRYGTIAAALSFAALGVWMIAAAGAFPRPSTLGAPGPARLPIIYAGILVGLSGLLIVQAFAGPAEPALNLKGLPRVVLLAAGTALSAWLWSRMNFLVLFVPATFLGVRLLGGGWLGSALTALICPGAIYLVFAVVLGIPFP